MGKGKSKRYIVIMVLLISVGYIYIGTHYQDDKVKKEFELFYSSSIFGRVVKVDRYSRESNFVVSNDSIVYRFYPHSDKNLNDSLIFRYLAKPGDSISKPAFSDTLLLFKGNKVYSYTFRRFR